MILNGSEILMEVLLEHKVDLVFGYPGGAVLHIYDALYKYQDKIKHILPVDECGACHMADGYARASGKTGVVIATSGPGATNLVTPLATAYMDSVPLVAITGNVPTSIMGKDSFQEVYIAGITMPITKHNFIVRDIDDLAKTVRKAFAIANSGRKGPVLVDIPKDISMAKTRYSKHFLKPSSEKYGNFDTELELIVDFIKESKKPLIYFGGGAKDASENLRSFMQKAKIPCVHTTMSAGTVAHNDPLNVGLLGMHGKVTCNTIAAEADLILAIGTRFSDRVALKPSEFGKNAKKVHIDIDKSEVDKNVGIDCSIVGDLNKVLAKLCDFVEPAKSTEWLAYIQKMLDKENSQKHDFKAFEPRNIIEYAVSKTKEEAIYTTDVGQHQMWAVQFIKHAKPRSFLMSGGLGTMGFGYGAAIGAKLAYPKRPVLHITGDGSFLMNLNEVATAVEYKIPVISIILNNQTLGMVRQWQASFYEKRYSNTDINKKVDYITVAKGFGAVGYSCKNLDEFKQAFDEALNLGKPVWIECLIHKDLKVLPMIPSGGTVKDIIVK
ncbi:biosynthetic-type acetolactate synthase large subunit [Campylobacter troglodytis]|uniref:biosynthetic-type acetolactate synthase large subunit n=1 Tax=Campylobacter troglodytis TaxID=654363 RepID=UPI00115C3270|nr:biosynthetic-type acetolactate synthase large subunit [Campylobacter troglodytis]TQR59574.1 biosynthetic-type acetolactate synthase large subunit [Campylobacter troglodytis]